MHRVVAAALIVAGLMAWSTTVDAEGVAIDIEGVSLVWVDLEGPQGLDSRGDPVAGVLDQGHDPVMIKTLTVNDEGLRDLTPLSVGVTVSAVNFPPDLTGVAASENGSLTPNSSADFGPSLSRIIASPDLRHYLRSDSLSQPGDGWGSDFDVIFGQALVPSDYLVIQESDPHAVIRLQALGPDGTPPSQAPIAVLSPGTGWNTGFASADNSVAQPVRLVVIDIDRLLNQTGLSALHGVRIDNDDESDFNLTAATAGSVTVVDTAATNAATVLPSAAPNTLGFTEAVYPGVDGGVGCTGAPSSAEAPPGQPVTYCYTVTNNGTEPIAQVTVTDADVPGVVRPAGVELAVLEPGHSALFFLEATLPAETAESGGEAHLSMATVTAVGVQTATDYTANAEAVVFAATNDLQPGLALELTAYAGHDGGLSCPGTDQTVVAEGAPITYCYRATNSGNTHLEAIVVDQSELDGVPTATEGNAVLVTPGQSVSFHLEAVAPAAPAASLIMAATATGNPVDATCTDLADHLDVVANDGTELSTTALTPPTAQQIETPEPPPATPPQVEDPLKITGGGAEQTSTPGAPTQLAFTGWETWLIALVGVGLVSGGWAAVREGARSRRPIPVPVEDGRPPPRS